MTSLLSFARLVRPILRLAIAGLVALATQSARADVCDSPDAPMVFPWTDPSTFATPIGVVPPEYPADLLQKGITAEVDAVLKISERGTLRKLLSVKASNGDEAFEKAVKDVVHYWNFQPYTNCECVPVEFTARLKIWFEIKEGKPSISISRDVSDPDRKMYPKPLAAINQAELVKAIIKSYPREGKRGGYGAEVYALASIDNQTGEVTDVDVRRVDTEPSYRRYFAENAKQALKVAKYDVKGFDPARAIKVCFSLKYQLTN